VGPDLWKVNNKYSKTDMISWISNTDAIYEKYNKKPINSGYPPMPNIEISTSESLKIINYLKNLDSSINPGTSVKLKGEVKNFSNEDDQDYEVSLESVMAEKVLNEKKILTKNGLFEVNNLKGNIAYRVKIIHDGIEYSTDKFYYMPEENFKDIDLTIYDSTQNSDSIEINSSHIVISYDEESDNLLFAEIQNVNNDSKYIYVGLNSLIEQKRNIIKFSKFSNIENLSFPHRSSETFIINDNSIVETIPMPPGQRRIVFTYTKQLDFFNTKLVKNFFNTIQSLTIIIPEDKINMKVRGLNFTKSQSDIKELKDESYVTYSFNNISKNDNLELTFSKPFYNYISTRIIIFIIFLILSSIVFLYLYKKNIFNI
tara:strand:- start:1870 stop:2982 length:1113 start_codon:yes stop_codon:yes gene_type:complete